MATKKEKDLAKATALSTNDFIRIITEYGLSRILAFSDFPKVNKNQTGLLNLSDYKALPYVGTLTNNAMILLSKGGKWGRQLVTIHITSSDCLANGSLTISATLPTPEKPHIKINKTGHISVDAKILYKVDEQNLYLYLYGTIAQGSSMGIILQSITQRPEHIGTVADISSYTEIEF